MTPQEDAVDSAPFDVRFELSGWSLLWADLEIAEGAAPDLAPLREETVRRVREERELSKLSAGPTVAALRKLFRAAGTDPTRYRPASEALLRRVLKGDDLPEIHPLVDLNNCLSARLAVPCCVMAEGTCEPPYVLRVGREGESYESLRGPFKLEGRPLLVDARGVCDTPITGNVRVKVEEGTRRAWLVAYLPAGVLGVEEAGAVLRELVGAVEGLEARGVYGVEGPAG